MPKKEKHMKSIAMAVASSVIFIGCAYAQAPADDTNTTLTGAASDKRADDASTPPNPDDAKVVFTTSGMPIPAKFWVSKSPKACEQFEPVGAVIDDGKKVLLPWIAKMNNKLNKLVMHGETSRDQYVKAGEPVQVKGLSGSEDRYGKGYSCGPIVSAFTPQKGRTYSVNFDFQGTQSCSQSVKDVTDPDHPTPVAYAVACDVPLAIDARKEEKNNFWKTRYESNLEAALKKEADAQSPSEKALAMKQEAAALDSLYQSRDALTVIDNALKIADPSQRKDLIATKAGILFALNDPQAALAIVTPELDKMRQLANSKSQSERSAVLSSYNEGFVTATFAHIQLEQWKEAVSTLADAYADDEGASFHAYRGLVYRYIMMRANDPSLTNAALEHDATDAAEHDKSHYGVLLRMYRGDDVSKELATTIADMSSGSDQQEALGESLFYRGAYAKFAKHDPAAGLAVLSQLNRIAPYGSIEWLLAKRLF
jgi:hypothetical protein